MVNKTKESRKQAIKAEKYILLFLLISYISGVCSGCYFVLSNKDNALFTSYITTGDAINVGIFFILSLLLKYSGILSVLLYFLPFFSGIQNSANYCNYLLMDNIPVYSIISDAIKDTAIVLLLILYIIVILSQILNRKFNIKKDLKYFLLYFSGMTVIYIIDYIITTVVF
ncbi:MAG: hypothetical protein E7484_01240 [Ruminococcaceae bacterium]|nr:hypothetical protein [Oscillospiraceae bacterium]